MKPPLAPSFDMSEVQKLLHAGGFETAPSQAASVKAGEATAKTAPSGAADPSRARAKTSEPSGTASPPEEKSAPAENEPPSLDATIARLEEMAKQGGTGIKRAKTNFGKTVVKGE